LLLGELRTALFHLRDQVFYQEGIVFERALFCLHVWVAQKAHQAILQRQDTRVSLQFGLFLLLLIIFVFGLISALLLVLNLLLRYQLRLSTPCKSLIIKADKEVIDLLIDLGHSASLDLNLRSFLAHFDSR